MFTSTVISSTPTASRTASNVSSNDGPPLLLIALVVIGAIWLVSFLARSEEPTVVVVQKQAGPFWSLALVALALGILSFVYIAPGSGPT